MALPKNMICFYTPYWHLSLGPPQPYILGCLPQNCSFSWECQMLRQNQLDGTSAIHMAITGWEQLSISEHLPRKLYIFFALFFFFFQHIDHIQMVPSEISQQIKQSRAWHVASCSHQSLAHRLCQPESLTRVKKCCWHLCVAPYSELCLKLTAPGGQTKKIS